MMDLAEAERVLTEALAVVRELRAEREEVDGPNGLSIEQDGWLTERQVAEAAGISVSAMQKTRWRKKSPPARTFHGHIYYRKSDVWKWLARRERHGLVRSGGLDDIDGDTSGI